MVQDRGGSKEERMERPDSDPGWQSFRELIKKKGNYFIDIEWEGVSLSVIYKWDYDYIGDQEGPQYLIVENVFIGDEFKLFDISPLLWENEDFAIFVETTLKEGE